jgi:transcriptional regulator with XRE-family HTH domain
VSRKELSQVIKTLRGNRTQAEIAKAARVTKNYITMLEAGKRKNPSLPVLRRLAKALGVPVAELLG